MKTFRNILIFILTAFLPECANANNSNLLQNVIKDLAIFEDASNTLQTMWKFKEIELSDGVLKEAYFDPSKTNLNQWDLISIDGIEATPSQKKDYQEAKPNADGKKESFFSDLKFSKVIDLETLVLDKVVDEFIHYSFIPSMQDEDSQGNFDGMLVINKNKQHVESVKIQNNGQLSPAFSVSLNEVVIAVHYAKVHDTLVIKQRELKILGKIGFFKKIQKKTTVFYSDHEPTYLTDSDKPSIISDQHKFL